MNTENKQDLLKRAIDSLVPSGYAKITEEGIYIPFHDASPSTLPAKYPFYSTRKSGGLSSRTGRYLYDRDY